jgi:RND family efflux transporter MFP subunit
MKVITYILFLLSLSPASFGKDKAVLPTELPFDVNELNKGQKLNDNIIAPKYSISHRISGQIAAKSKASLSFRVPGFVEKVVAKAGDMIKKGDLLAALDPIDFELQRAIAKTNKSQALLQETLARNEYNREKQLKQEGASTGAQLEQAEFKFKQAQISVQQADINLKSAERNLEHTKLRAPYNCIVATQYKDQAERIGIETPVFEIYEADSTEVNLDVPETLVGKVQVGTKVTINVPSVSYKENALVTKVVPIVSESTRTFRVTVVLKNSEHKVVPGLFAEAQIN